MPGACSRGGDTAGKGLRSGLPPRVEHALTRPEKLTQSDISIPVFGRNMQPGSVACTGNFSAYQQPDLTDQDLNRVDQELDRLVVSFASPWVWIRRVRRLEWFDACIPAAGSQERLGP